MHPKNISIAGYRYDLPPERIADYPLTERDDSKLLIYREGSVREDQYRNIGEYLPENSLLIFNNTRVVEARIVFQKATGARIELFCLEPSAEYSNITTAMLQTGEVRWKCLVGGASKWKPGQVLRMEIGGTAAEPPLVLEARWLEKLEGCFLIGLSWSPGSLSFAGLLRRAGLIPLPPYIHRAAGQSDIERYQTVYARHDGSVAAPTAGLHFTENIFRTLEAKNIRRSFVTLHVGAGTFMPVKNDLLEQHVMHSEFIVVDRATVTTILDSLGNEIIPVGTTSLRTVESLYWLGIKAFRDPAILPGDLVVRQWDAYAKENTNGQQEAGMGGIRGVGSPEAAPDISPATALKALVAWMDKEGIAQLCTKTQLLITPGYQWKIAGALITNFHQPGSTLLLLVAALVGDDWKKIYRYALDHSFRFLSYGDGSLLFRRRGEV
jgi:S-adenosylmethionine:tRNA ribosyltransferase-isomerase